MARYLVNGVVVDENGAPVPSTDAYYYNAVEDEARQRTAADAELRRQQEANAAAWAAQQPLPYPDAGFPPGYTDPFGGYVPGTEPGDDAGPSRNGGAPVQLFAGMFGGLPTWLLVVGAAAVLLSMRKRTT